MKKIVLVVITVFVALIVHAQSIGDTIVVQGFNYGSSVRDSVINFPTNSSVSYEKVIMRYAMRCKNGFVSSGTNRNYGCGEWDYSCNTYIHDDNSADSVAATIDKYQVAPNNSVGNLYSLIPTWKGIPILQQSVVVNSATMVDTAVIGVATTTNSNIINSQSKGKSFLFYSAAELQTAGLTSGILNAISLSSTSNNVKVKKLSVKLKQTSLSNLNVIDTSIINGAQEVYFHDYTFMLGENNIPFYNTFNWDGTSNLLVELTYEGKSGNAPLNLLSNSGSNSISSSDDICANLISSNNIEADSYLGISGNNDRTVEAWIKTSGSGEITTWGNNSSGEKQSFWVNGSGRLRLEISSGYSVGTTLVNDNQWHHVAYTFSGTTMADVKFYIDGVLDQISTTNSLVMNTQFSKLFQISKGFHNRYFNGQIDDIRVWSSALSQTTIQNWMHKSLNGNNTVANNIHPNVSSLELAYEFLNTSSNVLDLSPNTNNSVFEVSPSFIEFTAEDLIKNFVHISDRPNIKFYQGTFNITVSTDTIIDTVYNTPYIVTENAIYSNHGTTISDSIIKVNTNHYPPNNEMFNLSGSVVSSTPSSSQITLVNQTLNYFNRNPSKLEIMSFVTPYGINLDLGMEGKAWYFDVTDFTPVLTGAKRISLERGGQWQEEMDIQFLFIVGTPPAEVKKIQQIWKVDQRNYADINSNKYFAPRIIRTDPSASRFKLRMAITGHGQQGEFIARQHSLNVNSGAAIFNRLVWKECALNPVYPQGGTWIYDRAGWCPGMATDVNEYDVTPQVLGDSIQVDYDVSGATGDSRYIVNNQLISYGPINFVNDARIIDVIRPTNSIENGRRNPTCFNPIIRIQNTGSAVLTSATIEFSINGGPALTQTWTGSLNYMNEANVLLSVPQSFWSTALAGNNTFNATILTINGGADQYSYNNSINSNFEVADDFPNQVYIVLKTNSAASQTSYTVKNSAGATVFTKNGLSNNQVYADQLTLTPDCYQLLVSDSNDDGLSFFANSSGTGYLRIVNNLGIYLKTFNPDYGDGIEYYFTVGRTTGINEQTTVENIEVFPNPSDDIVYVTSSNSIDQLELINSIGQEVEIKVSENNSNSLNIDVSSLNSGIYYLKILSDSKTKIQKLIIK